MGVEKNLQKLLKEPTEMTIGEIKNILEFLGYKLFKVGGSHFHFKKHKKAPIIMPVHHNKVAKIYLKKLSQRIKNNLI